MKNKKGVSSLATTLLVMMTLFLCGISLYTITTTKNEVAGRFITLNAIFSFNNIEKQINLYIDQIFYQSLIETYYNFSTTQKYIFDECNKKGEYKVFCALNPEIDAEFTKMIKEKMKEKAKYIIFPKTDKDIEENFDKIKEKIIRNDFEVICKEEICFLRIRNITLIYNTTPKKKFLFKNKERVIISLRRNYDIEMVYNTSNIGLYNFKKIKEITQECLKENENINKAEGCIEDRFKLININISRDENEKCSCEEKERKVYYLFKIISKRLFFIDNNLKNIQLKFLLWKKERCEC